ncbi:hypothetical protein HU200_046643 [Digitaria exilis]|uniref:Reverse transcriptase zinc-binding domain-containing protein n=1 Tax=Digitaria exilis TaxID=1010633 RepID=A0A835B9G9_9POAL|nr:hypothetical protein HU200_046643 [Digitaria exilis]
MSVLRFPPGAIDALDHRRRCFLWSGEDSVSGAQCLVAWERPCQPKEQGGLGIKDLTTQNTSLLLKLLHRLYHPGDSAWGAGCAPKLIWSLCKATSFWLDRWCTAGRFADLFPLLFTHVVDEEASVAAVVQNGLANQLVPRLTRAAREEVQDRIQCRSNLFRKGIVEDVACAICGGNEDCDHVVLSCPFATQVRRGLGAGTEGVSAKTIWTVVRPTTIASKHYDCFLLLVCWMLWKHRNGVVFNSESPSLARFWRSCRDEARLWGHRLPPQDREVAEAWCCVFSST